MNGADEPDAAPAQSGGPLKRGGLVKTVGLLGGSFNPPHHGHLAISKAFQKACGLDRIAWLITPRNPLKDPSIYLPLSERVALAQALIEDDPAIFLWDIEKDLQTTESIQTIHAIKRLYPDIHFVWLMGADLLDELPLWPTWEAFLEAIPVAIYPRPPFTQKAKESLAATAYARAFLAPSQASDLPFAKPPCLLFLEGQEYDVSSTALRARAGPFHA